MRASYRESGARATARTAQLTNERMLVLADVPVRNGNLLPLTLEFEAEEHPEAQRIIDRVAGVQAEVRRRLRASNGDAPEASSSASTTARRPETPRSSFWTLRHRKMIARISRTEH